MIRHCRHDIYSQCTLYDCIEQYGYTMPELLGAYPIWDETKREWLNNEIYLYFENREIGSETPQQFASYAGRTMNRIMPRVNSIAAFALEGSNDWDVSSSSTSEQATSSTGENSSSATTTSTRTPELETQTDATSGSKATVLASDTPQVQLSGLENYMTQLNETGSEGESSSTVTQTGTETSSGTTSGTSSTEGETTSSGTVTSSNAQLSELASNWARTMPDLLGLIFEALESCFVQVM